MIRYFYCLLAMIIFFSCNQEQKIQRDYLDFNTNLNSSQSIMHLSVSQGFSLPQLGYNGKIKCLSATHDKDGGVHKHKVHLDTLGRTVKLEYDDYIYDTLYHKKYREPVVEVFAYYGDSDTIREIKKFKNYSEQIKRELFIYRNGLLLFDIELGANNELIRKREMTYNGKGQELYSEMTSSDGYISIEVLEYNDKVTFKE